METLGIPMSLPSDSRVYFHQRSQIPPYSTQKKTHPSIPPIMPHLTQSISHPLGLPIHEGAEEHQLRLYLSQPSDGARHLQLQVPWCSLQHRHHHGALSTAHLLRHRSEAAHDVGLLGGQGMEVDSDANLTRYKIHQNTISICIFYITSYNYR